MAIEAEFADFKIIKTRSVAQIILEVPIELADKALHELGGVPQPASNQRVAVAALNADRVITQEKPKQRFEDFKLAKQAGILCGDAAFINFLSEVYNWKSDPPNFIYVKCNIDSRRELDTNSAAAAKFKALQTDFMAWSGRIAKPR